MTAQAFVVTPADYERPLEVVGERITVLASNEKTGGYELFLQEGPEGSGPPPHSHAWDESFYVVRGEVDFGYGDRTLTAKAGTLVHLPAGTTHWFRFRAGGATMFSVTGAGQASHLFRDIDKELPPGPPDIARLLVVAARNGVAMKA